jgi:hypothetical protein
MGHFRAHTPQQQHAYSITPSARPSSGSGAVRPSALAVLRLMITSYVRVLSSIPLFVFLKLRRWYEASE